MLHCQHLPSNSTRFGRLNTFIGSAVLGALFSTLQVLPTSYELYWALEFLASLTSTGTIATSIVFNMEWVTSKYRVRLSNFSSILRIMVNYLTISFTAWYFSDNFTAFKLSLSIPGFFVIFLYLIFGESPKWLITQKKFTQAIKSISRAAKINRKPLQPYLIRQIEDSAMFASKEKALDQQSTKVTFGDILRNRILAVRLFVISSIWLLAMYSFFGILFASTKVHSNKYLSFMIIGLADIPGNIINATLMDRIGRKITIGSALLIYGAFLLASTQMPADGIMRLLIFFLGKTSLACAVTGLYPYSSELWPTSVRGTAFSFSSMTGRLGSIIASVSGLLVHYHEHLPVFTYSTTAIIASLLFFLILPETMHCERLPDTIEEALDIGKSRKRLSKNEKH